MTHDGLSERKRCVTLCQVWGEAEQWPEVHVQMFEGWFEMEMSPDLKAFVEAKSCLYQID